jgi:glycosyltransferase involved in cell wall biosynthesis
MVTVIVPVFNEERTVDAVLRRVQACGLPNPEILVVDDGSTDGTMAALAAWRNVPNVLVLRHAVNRGKGAAIATALRLAHGDITTIQDGDLEYDPNDLPRLAEAIQRDGCSVVYGSRFLRPAAPLPWTKFRLAVALLNLLIRLLYGRRLTDEATCYKAFRTDLLRGLDVQARRFEFCPEVTAKLCRLGVPIREIPISYHPRGHAQGKKIGWRDAWPTFWTLLKWRFLPIRRPSAARGLAPVFSFSPMPAAAATPACRPPAITP